MPVISLLIKEPSISNAMNLSVDLDHDFPTTVFRGIVPSNKLRIRNAENGTYITKLWV